jgi:transposase
LCRQAVDGRKHINTLAALVEQEMGMTPFDGSLFVFINKGRDVLKLLYFDRTGFALWLKRLEKDRFKFVVGQQSAKSMSLTVRQLELMLDGYDIFKMKAHEPVQYTRCV